MDGGDVSTGTVQWLAAKLSAVKVAEIDPAGFFIYNFPGSMEVSALFRPHTKIADGRIEAFQPPENVFLCDQQNRLVLFIGKEPNLNWEAFADCIFGVCSRMGVTSLYFVGSYAGMVPHTREPRLTSAVSDDGLRSVLEQYGLRFADYEGPASLSTHLMAHVGKRGFRMASLVAEIPAYVQGTNPKSIEAVIRKLTGLLDLEVDVDELEATASAWEQRVSEAVQDKEDLTELIARLEEGYDNEVFDTEMGDLKAWLVQQGIRVD
jgi:proteasome assembly chaperone (PAC2) family protein